VTIDDALLEDTAEDLFENAPCGYLSTRLDGTIVRLNRTFEAWIGVPREELLGKRRLQQLLAPGGRIYFETHIAPLLRMQGSVRAIAVEIVRADGSRLPALLNATVRTDDEGRPQLIRATIFDATDRRRYEQELLDARRREHDIALALQRSLLSGTLPAAPQLDLDVAYRPGVSGLEVGGDWYDAFWLKEGETVALAVGDVVGRGLGAAATMGQLRSALRALAATGFGPSALLEALDRYACLHEVGRMTTVVYCELELATGRLRYACAGHPPPVVVRPGEGPSILWGGRSTPLDAFRHGRVAREEAACELPPGSVLVLYTDGLVEDRKQPLQEGIDRLVGELAQHAATPAGPLVAQLVHALHGSENTDDTCVLAARLREADID